MSIVNGGVKMCAGTDNAGAALEAGGRGPQPAHHPLPASSPHYVAYFIVAVAARHQMRQGGLISTCFRHVF